MSDRKMYERAQMYFWWPGMWQDDCRHVEECDECQRHWPLVSDPMLRTSLPMKPWEAVAADLLEIQGQLYLVVVDYLSSWIKAVLLWGP